MSASPDDLHMTRDIPMDQSEPTPSEHPSSDPTHATHTEHILDLVENVFDNYVLSTVQLAHPYSSRLLLLKQPRLRRPSSLPPVNDLFLKLFTFSLILPDKTNPYFHDLGSSRPPQSCIMPSTISQHYQQQYAHDVLDFSRQYTTTSTIFQTQYMNMLWFLFAHTYQSPSLLQMLVSPQPVLHYDPTYHPFDATEDISVSQQRYAGKLKGSYSFLPPVPTPRFGHVQFLPPPLPASEGMSDIHSSGAPPRHAISSPPHLFWKSQDIPWQYRFYLPSSLYSAILYAIGVFNQDADDYDRLVTHVAQPHVLLHLNGDGYIDGNIDDDSRDNRTDIDQDMSPIKSEDPYSDDSTSVDTPATPQMSSPQDNSSLEILQPASVQFTSINNNNNVFDYLWNVYHMLYRPMLTPPGFVQKLYTRSIIRPLQPRDFTQSTSDMSDFNAYWTFLETNFHVIHAWVASYQSNPQGSIYQQRQQHSITSHHHHHHHHFTPQGPQLIASRMTDSQQQFDILLADLESIALTVKRQQHLQQQQQQQEEGDLVSTGMPSIPTRFPLTQRLVSRPSLALRSSTNRNMHHNDPNRDMFLVSASGQSPLAHTPSNSGVEPRVASDPNVMDSIDHHEGYMSMPFGHQPQRLVVPPLPSLHQLFPELGYNVQVVAINTSRPHTEVYDAMNKLLTSHHFHRVNADFVVGPVSLLLKQRLYDPLYKSVDLAQFYQQQHDIHPGTVEYASLAHALNLYQSNRDQEGAVDEISSSSSSSEPPTTSYKPDEHAYALHAQYLLDEFMSCFPSVNSHIQQWLQFMLSLPPSSQQTTRTIPTVGIHSTHHDNPFYDSQDSNSRHNDHVDMFDGDVETEAHNGRGIPGSYLPPPPPPSSSSTIGNHSHVYSASASHHTHRKPISLDIPQTISEPPTQKGHRFHYLYDVTISDGKHLTKCVLSPLFNTLVETGALCVGTILKVLLTEQLTVIDEVVEEKLNVLADVLVVCSKAPVVIDETAVREHITHHIRTHHDGHQQEEEGEENNHSSEQSSNTEEQHDWIRGLLHPPHPSQLGSMASDEDESEDLFSEDDVDADVDTNDDANAIDHIHSHHSTPVKLSPTHQPPSLFPTPMSFTTNSSTASVHVSSSPSVQGLASVRLFPSYLSGKRLLSAQLQVIASSISCCLPGYSESMNQHDVMTEIQNVFIDRYQPDPAILTFLSIPTALEQQTRPLLGNNPRYISTYDENPFIPYFSEVPVSHTLIDSLLTDDVMLMESHLFDDSPTQGQIQSRIQGEAQGNDQEGRQGDIQGNTPQSSLTLETLLHMEHRLTDAIQHRLPAGVSGLVSSLLSRVSHVLSPTPPLNHDDKHSSVSSSLLSTPQVFHMLRASSMFSNQYSLIYSSPRKPQSSRSVSTSGSSSSSKGLVSIPSNTIVSSGVPSRQSHGYHNIDGNDHDDDHIQTVMNYEPALDIDQSGLSVAIQPLYSDHRRPILIESFNETSQQQQQQQHVEGSASNVHVGGRTHPTYHQPTSLSELMQDPPDPPDPPAPLGGNEADDSTTTTTTAMTDEQNEGDDEEDEEDIIHTHKRQLEQPGAASDSTMTSQPADALGEDEDEDEVTLNLDTPGQSNQRSSTTSPVFIQISRQLFYLHSQLIMNSIQVSKLYQHIFTSIPTTSLANVLAHRYHGIRTSINGVVHIDCIDHLLMYHSRRELLALMTTGSTSAKQQQYKSEHASHSAHASSQSVVPSSASSTPNDDLLNTPPVLPPPLLLYVFAISRVQDFSKNTYYDFKANGKDIPPPPPPGLPLSSSSSTRSSTFVGKSHHSYNPSAIEAQYLNSDYIGTFTPFRSFNNPVLSNDDAVLLDYQTSNVAGDQPTPTSIPVKRGPGRPRKHPKEQIKRSRFGRSIQFPNELVTDMSIIPLEGDSHGDDHFVLYSTGLTTKQDGKTTGRAIPRLSPTAGVFIPQRAALFFECLCLDSRMRVVKVVFWNAQVLQWFPVLQEGQCVMLSNYEYQMISYITTDSSQQSQPTPNEQGMHEKPPLCSLPHNGSVRHMLATTPTSSYEPMVVNCLQYRPLLEVMVNNTSGVRIIPFIPQQSLSQSMPLSSQESSTSSSSSHPIFNINEAYGPISLSLRKFISTVKYPLQFGYAFDVISSMLHQQQTSLWTSPTSPSDQGVVPHAHLQQHHQQHSQYGGTPSTITSNDVQNPPHLLPNTFTDICGVIKYIGPIQRYRRYPSLALALSKPKAATLYEHRAQRASLQRKLANHDDYTVITGRWVVVDISNPQDPLQNPLQQPHAPHISPHDQSRLGETSVHSIQTLSHSQRVTPALLVPTFLVANSSNSTLHSLSVGDMVAILHIVVRYQVNASYLTSHEISIYNQFISETMMDTANTMASMSENMNPFQPDENASPNMHQAAGRPFGEDVEEDDDDDLFEKEPSHAGDGETLSIPSTTVSPNSGDNHTNDDNDVGGGMQMQDNIPRLPPYLQTGKNRTELRNESLQEWNLSQANNHMLQLNDFWQFVVYHYRQYQQYQESTGLQNPSQTAAVRQSSTPLSIAHPNPHSLMTSDLYDYSMSYDHLRGPLYLVSGHFTKVITQQSMLTSHILHHDDYFTRFASSYFARYVQQLSSQYTLFSLQNKPYPYLLSSDPTAADHNHTETTPSPPPSAVGEGHGRHHAGVVFPVMSITTPLDPIVFSCASLTAKTRQDTFYRSTYLANELAKHVLLSARTAGGLSSTQYSLLSDSDSSLEAFEDHQQSPSSSSSSSSSSSPSSSSSSSSSSSLNIIVNKKYAHVVLAISGVFNRQNTFISPHISHFSRDVQSILQGSLNYSKLPDPFLPLSTRIIPTAAHRPKIHAVSAFSQAILKYGAPPMQSLVASPHIGGGAGLSSPNIVSALDTSMRTMLLHETHKVNIQGTVAAIHPTVMGLLPPPMWRSFVELFAQWKLQQQQHPTTTMPPLAPSPDASLHGTFSSMMDLLSSALPQTNLQGADTRGGSHDEELSSTEGTPADVLPPPPPPTPFAVFDVLKAWLCLVKSPRPSHSSPSTSNQPHDTQGHDIGPLGHGNLSCSPCLPLIDILPPHVSSGQLSGYQYIRPSANGSADITAEDLSDKPLSPSIPSPSSSESSISSPSPSQSTESLSTSSSSPSSVQSSSQPTHRSVNSNAHDQTMDLNASVFSPLDIYTRHGSTLPISSPPDVTTDGQSYNANIPMMVSSNTQIPQVSVLVSDDEVWELFLRVCVYLIRDIHTNLQWVRCVAEEYSSSISSNDSTTLDGIFPTSNPMISYIRHTILQESSPEDTLNPSHTSTGVINNNSLTPVPVPDALLFPSLQLCHDESTTHLGLCSRSHSHVPPSYLHCAALTEHYSIFQHNDGFDDPHTPGDDSSPIEGVASPTHPSTVETLSPSSSQSQSTDIYPLRSLHPHSQYRHLSRQYMDEIHQLQLSPSPGSHTNTPSSWYTSLTSSTALRSLSSTVHLEHNTLGSVLINDSIQRQSLLLQVPQVTVESLYNSVLYPYAPPCYPHQIDTTATDVKTEYSTSMESIKQEQILSETTDRRDGIGEMNHPPREDDLFHRFLLSPQDFRPSSDYEDPSFYQCLPAAALAVLPLVAYTPRIPLETPQEYMDRQSTTMIRCYRTIGHHTDTMVNAYYGMRQRRRQLLHEAIHEEMNAFTTELLLGMDLDATPSSRAASDEELYDEDDELFGFEPSAQQQQQLSSTRSPTILSDQSTNEEALDTASQRHSHDSHDSHDGYNESNRRDDPILSTQSYQFHHDVLALTRMFPHLHPLSVLETLLTKGSHTLYNEPYQQVLKYHWYKQYHPTLASLPANLVSHENRVTTDHHPASHASPVSSSHSIDGVHPQITQTVFNPQLFQSTVDACDCEVCSPLPQILLDSPLFDVLATQLTFTMGSVMVLNSILQTANTVNRRAEMMGGNGVSGGASSHGGSHIPPLPSCNFGVTLFKATNRHLTLSTDRLSLFSYIHQQRTTHALGSHRTDKSSPWPWPIDSLRSMPTTSPASSGMPPMGLTTSYHSLNACPQHNPFFLQGMSPLRGLLSHPFHELRHDAIVSPHEVDDHQSVHALPAESSVSNQQVVINPYTTLFESPLYLSPQTVSPPLTTCQVLQSTGIHTTLTSITPLSPR